MCYAALMAITAIYFDFLSKDKLPHLGIINFGLSVINFTIIGYLLYHWDKVRKYNLEIDRVNSSIADNEIADDNNVALPDTSSAGMVV